jgi:acetamidase/formamidase
MTHHHLGASPDTVHWGWFDAAMEPVLTIDSGDRITIESVSIVRTGSMAASNQPQCTVSGLAPRR